MKNRYPSYITRKNLTLKYKKVTEDTIREVVEIFYTHIAGKGIFLNYRIRRKEKLIKELTKYYIDEQEEYKTVDH